MDLSRGFYGEPAGRSCFRLRENGRRLAGHVLRFALTYEGAGAGFGVPRRTMQARGARFA